KLPWWCRRRYWIEIPRGAHRLPRPGRLRSISGAELRLRNWAPFPVDRRSIGAVLLTHAHLDHTGYLPLLVKRGFSGPVYCSRATADLAKILLPDSGHLQELDAEYANRHGYSKRKPALPLYTQADAERALKLLEPLEFNQEREIVGGATM